MPNPNPDRTPKTKTMKASEARQQFSQVINQVFREETRVIVEKNGIPVAAIISARDLEFFEYMEALRTEHFKVLDDTRAAFADIPDEELEREINRAIAEVRAANRKEREKEQSA